MTRFGEREGDRRPEPHISTAPRYRESENPGLGPGFDHLEIKAIPIGVETGPQSGRPPSGPTAPPLFLASAPIHHPTHKLSIVARWIALVNIRQGRTINSALPRLFKGFLTGSDPIKRAVGGGRGIRTLDTIHHRIHTFQACAFNRSAIPPLRGADHSRGRGGVQGLSHRFQPKE